MRNNIIKYFFETLKRLLNRLKWIVQLFCSNGKNFHYFIWMVNFTPDFMQILTHSSIGGNSNLAGMRVLRGWNSKKGGRERKYRDRGWSEGESRGWGGQLNWEGMKGRVLCGRYHVTCLLCLGFPFHRPREIVEKESEQKILLWRNFLFELALWTSVGGVYYICIFLKNITYFVLVYFKIGIHSCFSIFLLSIKIKVSCPMSVCICPVDSKLPDRFR